MRFVGSLSARVNRIIAREQERIPAARVEFRLVSRDSPPPGNGSPGSGRPEQL